MKAIAAAVILVMSAGLDCNNPTGSSGSSSTSSNTRSHNSSPGNFNGWVTDAVTHGYIEGALVCLEAAPRCTKSGVAADYRLRPNTTGTLTIVTTHADYKPDTTTAWVGYNSTRLNIRLSPIGM